MPGFGIEGIEGQDFAQRPLGGPRIAVLLQKDMAQDDARSQGSRGMVPRKRGHGHPSIDSEIATEKARFGRAPHLLNYGATRVLCRANETTSSGTSAFTSHCHHKHASLFPADRIETNNKAVTSLV
jgi:hypothetical protein